MHQNPEGGDNFPEVLRTSFFFCIVASENSYHSFLVRGINGIFNFLKENNLLDQEMTIRLKSGEKRVTLKDLLLIDNAWDRIPGEAHYLAWSSEIDKIRIKVFRLTDNVDIRRAVDTMQLEESDPQIGHYCSLLAGSDADVETVVKQMGIDQVYVLFQIIDFMRKALRDHGRILDLIKTQMPEIYRPGVQVSELVEGVILEKDRRKADKDALSIDVHATTNKVIH